MLTPRTRSLYAFVGSTPDPYGRSPARKFDEINRRLSGVAEPPEHAGAGSSQGPADITRHQSMGSVLGGRSLSQKIGRTLSFNPSTSTLGAVEEAGAVLGSMRSAKRSGSDDMEVRLFGSRTPS